MSAKIYHIKYKKVKLSTKNIYVSLGSEINMMFLLHGVGGVGGVKLRPNCVIGGVGGVKVSAARIVWRECSKRNYELYG